MVLVTLLSPEPQVVVKVHTIFSHSCFQEKLANRISSPRLLDRNDGIVKSGVSIPGFPSRVSSIDKNSGSTITRYSTKQAASSFQFTACCLRR